MFIYCIEQLNEVISNGFDGLWVALMSFVQWKISIFISFNKISLSLWFKYHIIYSMFLNVYEVGKRKSYSEKTRFISNRNGENTMQNKRIRDAEIGP